MAVSQDKEAEGRLKSVDNAITQIHRQFGKGSIMRLGEHERENVPAISTGTLGIDIALGVGGLPRGRATEIYGPESSGKTTLALHVIAEAQKAGGNAAFIDAEHALDIDYAGRLGVDVDNLLVSQPDYGEQALEICEVLMRSGGLDVIVIDSVAALVPRAEIDGNVGDHHVGLQARLMSHAKDGQEVIGNRTKVKVVKNKVAPPFKIAEFDMIYGEGISKTGDLLDLGVEQELIDKSGAWYSYNDERIGQGRENAKAFLKEHPDMLEEIDRKVRLGYGLPVAGEAPVAEVKDAVAQDGKAKK
jgi:recombination protein RecA